jgi:hypothetical protein
MNYMSPELSVEATNEIRKPFKKEFPAKRVAKELARMAFSDIADFIRVDKNGSVRVLPFDTLGKEKTRVIKKIRERRQIVKDEDEETVINETLEFELYDKQDALEAGAKLAGYEPSQQIEHGGTVIVEVLDFSDNGSKPKQKAARKDRKRARR